MTYPPTPTQPNNPCHTQTTLQYSHNTQKHETAATQLQDYIHTLEHWLTNNRMKVSTNKSSVTLITPHNTEYRTQPQVTLNNTPLPVTHSTTPNPRHSKEGITTIYKQYIRPILTYAHTAWQPDTAKTHINELQTTQNIALPIARWCTQTPLWGNSIWTWDYERHTHLHIHSRTTLHAKPNTNTE